jgi:hypothetical protein
MVRWAAALDAVARSRTDVRTTIRNNALLWMLPIIRNFLLAECKSIKKLMYKQKFRREF